MLKNKSWRARQCNVLIHIVLLLYTLTTMTQLVDDPVETSSQLYSPTPTSATIVQSADTG